MFVVTVKLLLIHSQFSLLLEGNKFFIVVVHHKYIPQSLYTLKKGCFLSLIPHNTYKKGLEKK